MASQYVTPQWIRNNADLLAHIINATYHVAQHQGSYVPEVTPDGYCIMRREVPEYLYATPSIRGPTFQNFDNSIDEVDEHSMTVNVGSLPTTPPNILYASLQHLNEEDLIEAIRELDMAIESHADFPEHMDELSQIISREENADSTTNGFEVDLEQPQGGGCDVRSCDARGSANRQTWYIPPTSPPPSQTHEDVHVETNRRTWYLPPTSPPPTQQPFRAEGTSTSQGEIEVPVQSPKPKEEKINVDEGPYSIYDIPLSSRPISYDLPPTPRPFIAEPSREAPYYYSETSAAQIPATTTRPRWITESCRYSEDHRPTASSDSSCLWSCWRNAVQEEACDSIEYYQV